MNSRNTTEMKASQALSSGLSKESNLKKSTLSMQKPSCKNGVCEILWKPAKPAA